LRVIKCGDGIEQTIDYMHFIENGKLDGDEGYFLKLPIRHGAVLAMFEVEINNGQAVKAVACEGEKHGRIETEPDPRGDV
jgi:hypothetical protein